MKSKTIPFVISTVIISASLLLGFAASASNLTDLSAIPVTTTPDLTNYVVLVYGTNATNIARLALVSDIKLAQARSAYTVSTTDFVLNTYYTNGGSKAWVSASFTLTAAAAGTAKVGLYIDQTASGTFDNTGPQIAAGPLAALVSIQQLASHISPGARYVFTNLSSGSGETSAIVAGTSQNVNP